jgi:hypothetical protein
MLYAIFSVCAAVTFAAVLAVSHTSKSHRLAHLFRALEERSEMTDGHDSPADDFPTRGQQSFPSGVPCPGTSPLFPSRGPAAKKQ